MEEKSPVMNELLILEDQFPEYDDINSPTKRVGSDILSNFNTC